MISQDVDIYGRQQANGDLLEYYDIDAVNNALQLWLALRRGELLRNPAEGGALDSFKFKTMTDDILNLLRFNLINSINNSFAPSLTVSEININPLYTERAVEIIIKYVIQSTNQSGVATVYINTQYSKQNFEYEDVIYIEKNLLEFCEVKKPDMSGKMLKFNSDLAKWVWGRYLFVNFTNSDPYFDDIFATCNS